MHLLQYHRVELLIPGQSKRESHFAAIEVVCTGSTYTRLYKVYSYRCKCVWPHPCLMVSSILRASCRNSCKAYEADRGEGGGGLMQTGIVAMCVCSPLVLAPV